MINLLKELLPWILGSGGLGATITYLGNYKSKKKLEEELAKQTQIDTKNKYGIMEKDRFEAMYKQITDMAKDYNDLSDQFREYRRDARTREDEFDDKLRLKNNELASIKDQVRYLKRLRCYDLDCPNRIKNNPNLEQ